MPPANRTGSFPLLAGEVVSVGSRGECLVGRGADNSKGPLAGVIAVVKAMIAASGTCRSIWNCDRGGGGEGKQGPGREFLTQKGRALRRCRQSSFPEFASTEETPKPTWGSKALSREESRFAAEWGGPTTHAQQQSPVDQFSGLASTPRSGFSCRIFKETFPTGQKG